MKAVIVEYAEAKLLADNHRDVIVYEAASGDVCRFEDYQWPYRGAIRVVDQILEEVGTGFMDNHYTFVWIKS